MTRSRTQAAASPCTHAVAAAEAIRMLCHATLFPDDARGYHSPSDVDATLAELELLAMRLPQALTQASLWTTEQARCRQLDADPEIDDLAHAVAWLTAALDEAAAHAQALSTALMCARQTTTHLHQVELDPDQGGAR